MARYLKTGEGGSGDGGSDPKPIVDPNDPNASGTSGNGGGQGLVAANPFQLAPVAYAINPILGRQFDALANLPRPGWTGMPFWAAQSPAANFQLGFNPSGYFGGMGAGLPQVVPRGTNLGFGTMYGYSRGDSAPQGPPQQTQPNPIGRPAPFAYTPITAVPPGRQPGSTPIPDTGWGPPGGSTIDRGGNVVVPREPTVPTPTPNLGLGPFTVAPGATSWNAPGHPLGMGTGETAFYQIPGPSQFNSYADYAQGYRNWWAGLPTTERIRYAQMAGGGPYGEPMSEALYNRELDLLRRYASSGY